MTLRPAARQGALARSIGASLERIHAPATAKEAQPSVSDLATAQHVQMPTMAVGNRQKSYR